MLEVHIVNAWLVIVGNGLVGAWALLAHRFELARVKALWVATALAQVLIVAQAILGVVVQNQTGVDPGPLHLLYGFFGMAMVGMVYSYKAQLVDHRHLLYGFTGLFLSGLSVRAFFL